VRPIAAFPDLLAVVTEETRGENVLALTERRTSRLAPMGSAAGASLEHTFENIGYWVRRYQDIEGVAGPLLFDTLREYLDIRLKKLVAMPPAAFEEGDRQRVLAYVRNRQGEIDGDRLLEVPVHSDLAPGNVIADGERVVVLDFAMARRGPLYHDVARCYAQMDLLKLKPFRKRHQITALQTALLRGFDPALRPTDPLFAVLLLIQKVNHLGTLSSRAARGWSGLYDRWVARHHRSWLDQTVR